jgi:hypothetical protein
MLMFIYHPMGEYCILNKSVSASLKMNFFNYSPSVFSMLWLMNRLIQVLKKSTKFRKREGINFFILHPLNRHGRKG